MERAAILKGAAAVLAVAFALAGCGQRQALLTDEKAPSATLGERVQVLAADTLVIDKKPVRLANAFAPEPIPQARCWAEAVASNEATEIVRDIVRGGSSVDVRATGGVDEYNRPFSLVTIDGLDLGQMLYDRGLAAKPGATRRRFEWCNAISQNDHGAPTLSSLLKY